MVGAVLPLLLVALLAAGQAAGGAAGSPSTRGLHVPSQPAVQAPPIRLTVVNWGHPASLLDSAHPGWGHLAPLAGPTQVTATIELPGLRVHGWIAHLDAPLAFGGEQPADCRGSEEAGPTELSCVFRVPVSSGLNPLTVTFTADGRVVGAARGSIRGGELSWDAAYELLDATGHWTVIARDHAVAMPATARTALRQVITNTGTIPMRVDDTGNPAACDTRVLAPSARLVCPSRGIRPAQSLAGDLRRELRVVDAVGGVAEFEIRGGLTTFAGTFSLSRASAVVGQAMVVQARGLPRDPAFEVQFWLDDEANVRPDDLLGTSVTPTGTVNYRFVVPRASPGAFRLNVVHDGIAIASLPFEVTTVPRAADAAVPPWGFLAIPLVVLLGLLVFWRVRRRRRRLRAPALAEGSAATATPEPPQTDPYLDASPATRAPEADRPR